MEAASATVKAGAVLKKSGSEALELVLSGAWTLGGSRLQAADTIDQIKRNAGSRRLAVNIANLAGWDASLISFLFVIYKYCALQKIEIDQEGLPEAVQRILKLALAVPERKGARRMAVRLPFLAKVGSAALKLNELTQQALEFVGEACVAFSRLLTGKARMPRYQLWQVIETSGPRALGIVTLISLLVGLILAFIGAIQLQQFGAQIYVANLVGLAMAREMGAIMVAIIMSGRTGAAFAAQLGTMQVNEEIDALKTLGIAPMEFLVLPRMLALILMMPLLCLYADLMGILGGLIVGVGTLDISAIQYFQQTQGAVGLMDIGIGLVKSLVFGLLVALIGCMRGIRCGRSAEGVGQAVTSAVVSGIVAIVVTDALFAIVCSVIGI